MAHPVFYPQRDHEPGLGVLLVAPAVTEPGPEGGAGAGAPPTLWIPDEPVTLGTRATRKLSVTFLNKTTSRFFSLPRFEHSDLSHLVTGPQQMIFLTDAVVHDVLEAGVHLDCELGLLGPGTHGGHPLGPHPGGHTADRPQHQGPGWDHHWNTQLDTHKLDKQTLYRPVTDNSVIIC